MARKPKLTLNKIEKKDKIYDKMETFTFEDGETLKYNPHFRPSTVNDLLEEYVQDISAIETATDTTIREQDKYYYLLFLMIKHFTELGEQISNDISEKINQMNNIVDSVYFEQMVTDMFDSSQIRKIEDVMINSVAKMEQMEKHQERLGQVMDNLDLQYKDEIKKVLIEQGQMIDTEEMQEDDNIENNETENK